jgi:acyl carrier protein
MSQHDKLEHDLKNFLVERLFVEMPVEEIRTDMGLPSEVGVDSLGFTELMAHLEDAYGIRVSQEEFGPENFRNLDRVMAFVRRKTAQAA